MPNTTCYGLKITLRAALQICTFLTDECNFYYLMTARLNQDNLERFFGLMRECCGANDHPDSVLFMQMYRLVSTYSLVTPSKGCNVSGSELVKVLLSIRDISDKRERENQWIDQLDTILDRGENVDIAVKDIMESHDYHVASTSDYVLAYLAGYIARQARRRFAKFGPPKRQLTCESCIKSLMLHPEETIPETHQLIKLKTRGHLLHPAQILVSLISILERATMETMQKVDTHEDILFDVTKRIEELPPLPRVGVAKNIIEK